MSTDLFLTQAMVPFQTAVHWSGGAGFADSYAWHQRVWELFPGQADLKRNFLTRLDPLSDAFRLLILSRTRPARPDWCPPAIWKSKPVPGNFLEHEAYEFSLTANPTVKVRTGPHGEPLNNSRRIAITHKEDRMEENGRIRPGLISWLARQAAQNGFELGTGDPLSVGPRTMRAFVRKGILGQHAAVEFRGRLRVTDRAAFIRAYRLGIGSARAFGFGMLCLIPCHQTEPME